MGYVLCLCGLQGNPPASDEGLGVGGGAGELGMPGGGTCVGGGFKLGSIW